MGSVEETKNAHKILVGNKLLTNIQLENLEINWKKHGGLRYSLWE
jgi:hypothetical protein